MRKVLKFNSLLVKKRNKTYCQIRAKKFKRITKITFQTTSQLIENKLIQHLLDN